jgi:ferrous iron transport protein B
VRPKNRYTYKSSTCIVETQYTSVLNYADFIKKSSPSDKVIALAGNPNVGKSTVFNGLTGMKQHTGNWPGKTVATAQGSYKYKGENYVLVDLPGTYSIAANSADEEVARDFICFGQPDVTVVVTDATCLERNLYLTLQVLEITSNVVLCVNLIDEAKNKQINVDLKKLSDILGIPVVGTNARDGKGLDALISAIYDVAKNGVDSNKVIKIKYNEEIESSIESIKSYFDNKNALKTNPRWLALRILENDSSLIKSIWEYCRSNFHINFEENELLYALIKRVRQKLYSMDIDTPALRDEIASEMFKLSEEIYKEVVSLGNTKYHHRDLKIDRILTSRKFGIPIMLALLATILWITIKGANYPSELITTFLFWLQGKFTIFFQWIEAPPWLHGLLIEGVYRTLAWVVSVMFPPMAIFFPLFTLLEDLGYLPRVAFNLDNYFKKACAHGKQILTMCMGFGCNCVGVTGCRIIDSPREKLIAIITNNFVPCNGRFPTLIAVIAMFFAGAISGPFNSVLSALLLTGVIVFGIIMTLIISKILSKTLLKGLPSSFTLELPPYRVPQIGKVIVRSVFDRTLFVLGRAVTIAMPAGLLLWIMANNYVGDTSLLVYCANVLDPFAQMIGLDGFILLAFILGLPANEIVIPIIIMSYINAGALIDLSSLDQLRELLVSNGWTWLTGLCVMLFSLMHWPCGTTLWTIKKETKSLKWTLVSFLVPTLTGLAVCFIVANIVRLLGLV